MIRIAVRVLIFLACLCLCLPALVGTREIVLRSVDCAFCRRVVSLVMRPDDINGPIAVVPVSGLGAKFFVFPRYVGPHAFQFFPTVGAPPVALSSIECDSELNVYSVHGQSKSYPVFSSFGQGMILGGMFIGPEIARGKSRPSCRLSFLAPTEGTLVIVRASEL